MLNSFNIRASVAFFSFLAAYFPTWQILIDKWANSEEYSHAFLTLPLLLYFAWNKRMVLLPPTKPRFSLVGLLLLFLANAFYLLALLTQVHTLIALAMFLTILGAVLFLGGTTALAALATPLILFAMLIPLPEQLYIQLTFPLQLMVSQASEIIVTIFRVPLFREGNIMHIPGKTFEVIDACSGLRSAIALMTLSVVMGYMMLHRTTTKLVLFAASIPTAVLVNLIRVVAMILLYHFFRLDLTEGILHTSSGMAIFVVAFLILFSLQRVLESWESKQKQNS